jgi:hypothetical protein
MPKEVTIGSQVWTATNLDVSTYRNGDSIPQVQSQYYWGNLTTGAWCYYENKTANGTKYGKLYNWYAVNDPRGIAPKGYHIPTDEEWTILTDNLGGEELAGAKMKSRSGWLNNSNGTNTSGFAALPGGRRDGDGTFYFIGTDGYWWSSGDENDDAWVRGLTGSLYKGSFNRSSGFSVRCLRD